MGPKGEILGVGRMNFESKIRLFELEMETRFFCSSETGNKLNVC